MIHPYSSFLTDQREGTAPSAAEARKIGDFLNRVANTPPQSDGRGLLSLLKLTETLGEFRNSGREYRQGRTGKFQRWDGDEIALVEFAKNAETKAIVDPFGLPFDRDELVVTFSHGGREIPLNPRTVCHAITWPETTDEESSDGACTAITNTYYPTAGDNPTVYPIKFVRLSYTEEAGHENPQMSYLTDSLCHDGHVFNIVEDLHIPAYSVIQVYSVIGKDGKPSGSRLRAACRIIHRAVAVHFQSPHRRIPVHDLLPAVARDHRQVAVHDHQHQVAASRALPNPPQVP